MKCVISGGGSLAAHLDDFYEAAGLPVLVRMLCKLPYHILFMYAIWGGGSFWHMPACAGAHSVSLSCSFLRCMVSGSEYLAGRLVRPSEDVHVLMRYEFWP